MRIKQIKNKLALSRALNMPFWKTPRIFNGKNRIPIGLLETLQKQCYDVNNEKFSTENIEKNIVSLGTHAHEGIYKPKFPFKLNDLVYVYSHLIFDGSAGLKGSYFMAAEKDVLEYHKNRLQNFGEIKTNFVEDENQLYIPWIIVYIIKKNFDTNSFKSLEAFIPPELKAIAMENKEIANEFVKAAIIDEGWIEDKISFAISNRKLCKDVWEISGSHYGVGTFPNKPRERIGITGKRVLEWRWIILSKSMKDFYENIELPISHKQEKVKFAVKRQSRNWKQRKPKETRKMIVKSLLNCPKSIKELSFEMNIRTTSVLNLINGVHCPTKESVGLKELGLIEVLEYRRNSKGERTGKFPIYYVRNEQSAKNFLKEL